MTTAVTDAAAQPPRQLRSCLIYKALGKNQNPDSRYNLVYRYS